MKKIIVKMKKTLGVILSALMILTFIPAMPARAIVGPTGHIVINEVQMAGSIGGVTIGGDEFVELYNAGPTTNVLGWKLQYQTVGSTTWTTKYTFGDYDFKSGSYFLIAPIEYDGTVIRDANMFRGLPLTGGQVRIANDTGTKIDKVGWGSSDNPETAAAPAPAENESIQRASFIDTDDNSMDFTVNLVPTPTSSDVAPSTPSLVSPAAEDIIVDKTPLLDWSDSVDGDGDTFIYEFQIDRAESEADLDWLGLTASGSTAESHFEFELPAELGDGSYYWRVRAYNPEATSEWSTYIHFTIDTMPPYIPGHLTPNDTARVKSIPSVEISWEDKPEMETSEVTFDVEVSETSDLDELSGGFVVTYLSERSLTETSLKLETLKEDMTYFWHVRARDEAGNASNWSKTWSFATDNVAPAFNDLTDISANAVKEVEIKNISDVDTLLNYKWTEETGKVQFGEGASNIAELSATEDGTYDISVTVSDSAGNSKTKTFKFTWDTSVNPVENLYAVTGDGYVDLHWTNPSDSDFARLKIYRSTNLADSGNLLAALTKDETIYEDETVISGVTYYYRIVAVDRLGNLSLSRTMTVTPELATVVPQVTPTSQTTTKVKPKTEEPKQEVKAATNEAPKQEPKTEEKGETKTLPYFGIAVLIILALVGIYLLYLQNPEFFKRYLKRKK